MDFDKLIDRRGTHCSKWDEMERLYGVSADDGIAMWVADMDFRPPQAVQDALQKMLDHGVYGYFGGDGAYRESIAWWMRERHGWSLDKADIFTTHGLVNGTGLSVAAFTQPGDGVVLFTPVYHAFARTIRAAGREVVECPLVNNAGRYEFDFAAYDAQMTGTEKMVILCSPHNPGGRVWTREELQGVADFAKRHDLILVSDEIHHDLVMPGHTHTPMTLIEGVEDRLVMMTAATKTFNIAGSHTGNVIIANPELKAKFAQLMGGLGISPNSFGLHMVTAAYSPAGAEWVDALNLYLDGNRRLLEEGLSAIPGVKAMPLEATYLSWVDFAGTGMSEDEIKRRVLTEAGVAANYGPTFGKGGETFLRFNFATPRARVADAVARITAAFEDLQ
ncbi:cystathione beta-lyase [Ketogulonicigenium robustum]|uniref:cysteine-S-conjugate beta-lyase n=1 Tax=Ketogulonicigenium robustum TaxID=92947 RepID=A0A1W6NX34_9RHOB|nr:MalY/PatB family protein [Ketogulonicigenium robustum]ARO13784.1 cystathione beta-lyase [Ketogulonicigenium robustum]